MRDTGKPVSDRAVSGKAASDKAVSGKAVSRGAVSGKTISGKPVSGRPILRYERVTVSYHGSAAVRDVSFVLHQGEILGIAGESGSGKSTLLKVAMGLLGVDGQVDRGAVWYDGSQPGDRPLNLTELSPKERRAVNGAKIALVFQDAGSSFCPVRTVEAQLWEAVRVHARFASFGTGRAASGTGRAAFTADAAALFRNMGLQDPERVLGSYPFELSGGMAQRVGIAAAMLSRPAVLLADEPTSALDVSVQRQVVEELLSIRALYGVSMIVVTHNLGVIRAMADRMLVMRDGEIVEAGETSRVLEQPESAYTRSLLAAVPRLRREGES